MLLTIFSLYALAAQPSLPLEDDDTMAGYHYHCTNLKGALILEPSGQVSFVLGYTRPAPEAGQLDRSIVPAGRGGRLLSLGAWAAGTIVRLPDDAALGPATFRLP